MKTNALYFNNKNNVEKEVKVSFEYYPQDNVVDIEFGNKGLSFTLEEFYNFASEIFEATMECECDICKKEREANEN